MLRKAIAVAFCLIAPIKAYACSCSSAAVTPREHIDAASVVAYGEDIDARLLDESEYGRDHPTLRNDGHHRLAIATFRVAVNVKGAKAGDELTVYYYVEGTSCDMPPAVGFATFKFFVLGVDGFYYAPLCMNDWGGIPERTQAYLLLFEELSGHDFPGIN